MKSTHQFLFLTSALLASLGYGEPTERAATAPTLEAADALLGNPDYNFQVVKGRNYNAILTAHGNLENRDNLQLEIFPGYGEVWFSLKVGFGEVRHVWRNHTPLAEGGIISFASQWRDELPAPNAPGRLVPGFSFEGLAYRMNGLAPYCRTQIVPDRYVQLGAEDPITHALQFREELAAASGHPGDMTNGLWGNAHYGW